MQYEQQYRILKTDGSVVEGQYIQTRGDDQNYPTFVLADGSRLGVRKDAVLGPVIDDCPVDGIERIDCIIPYESKQDRIDCDILDVEAEEERYRGYTTIPNLPTGDFRDETVSEG